MRLLLSGSRGFGAAVLELARAGGHDVAAVFSPPRNTRGDGPDRLRRAAESAEIPWHPPEALAAQAVPEGTDLIVSAHGHAFVGRETRAAARLGAIGYHPSLLPLHRGRDAIAWSIRMRERVTGGSVYWLTDGLDAGDLAAQAHVLVRHDDDPAALWRRELFPLGLNLLQRVLDDLSSGRVIRVPQAHALATWEPAIGRPPLHRPELPRLGSIPGYGVSTTFR